MLNNFWKPIIQFNSQLWIFARFIFEKYSAKIQEVRRSLHFAFLAFSLAKIDFLGGGDLCWSWLLSWGKEEFHWLECCVWCLLKEEVLLLVEDVRKLGSVGNWKELWMEVHPSGGLWTVPLMAFVVRKAEASSSTRPKTRLSKLKLKRKAIECIGTKSVEH